MFLTCSSPNNKLSVSECPRKKVNDKRSTLAVVSLLAPKKPTVDKKICRAMPCGYTCKVQQFVMM